MNEQQAHTPGPWFLFGNPAHCVGGPHEENGTAGVAMCGMRLRDRAEAAANARFIAAAPAMDLALALLCAGLAKIDRFGGLVEFCFDGLRYSHNGDWIALLDVIGWDKARAAVAKTRGQ